MGEIKIRQQGNAPQWRVTTRASMDGARQDGHALLAMATLAAVAAGCRTHGHGAYGTGHDGRWPPELLGRGQMHQRLAGRPDARGCLLGGGGVAVGPVSGAALRVTRGRRAVAAAAGAIDAQDVAGL